jgi:hypothetical protein
MLNYALDSVGVVIGMNHVKSDRVCHKFKAVLFEHATQKTRDNKLEL